MEIALIAVVVVIGIVIFTVFNTNNLNSDQIQEDLLELFIKFAEDGQKYDLELLEFIQSLHKKGVRPSISSRLAHIASLAPHRTDPDKAEFIRHHARAIAKQYPAF